jgi:ElaA protein
MVSWRCLHFDELSLTALYAILAARAEVFVVEQNCFYLDPDDHDQSAFHLLGKSESGELLAYLRILPPGEKYPGMAAMGRILTRGPGRGVGLGKALVAEGIQQSRRLFPGAPLKISAQAHLEQFYAGFGFVTVSTPYDDAGIPHLDMVLADPPALAIEKPT